MVASKVLLVTAQLSAFLGAGADGTCLTVDLKNIYGSDDALEIVLLQKDHEFIVGVEADPADDPFLWAERNGANTSLVTSSVFEHGGRSERGLAAKRHTRKGDVLLSVPMGLVLSSAGTPPVAWRGAEPHCAALWNDGVADARLDVVSPIAQRLTLMLLHEHLQGAQSPWFNFLSYLPTAQEFESFFPLIASNDSLDEFDGLPLAEKARSFQHTYRTLLASIEHHRCFGDEAPTQLGDLLWLAANVKSRHYLTTCEYGNTTSECGLLVPISDLANTQIGAEPNTEWPWQNVLRPDGAFHVIASLDIAAGEELFEFYGHGSNEYFASVWGFWEPDNPTNVAPLSEEKCAELRPARKLYVDAAGRCKPGTLPVRCTFARITYESCESTDEVQS